MVALIACTASRAPAAPPPAASNTAPPTAAPTAPPQRLSLSIGYSSLSDSNLGLWVAQDGGYFEQYGLDVDKFPYITSGTLTVQALLGGDIQFAAAGGEAIVDAVLEGSDLAMIAGASNKFDFALIAGPNIHSAADLQGKRVGVSKFGSSSDFAARTALERLGLDPDHDVTILQVGGTGERLSALESGAIEATPEIPPTLFEAEKRGFSVLIDLAQLGVPYEEGPISTTRTVIDDHPELVQRFIRAYLAGIHGMKTDKAFAVQVSAHYTHLTDQPILEQSWERFAQGSIPAVPYLTDAAIEPVLKQLAPQLAAAASAKPSDFYDNRFLQQAVDSGFVQQLDQS